MQTDTPRLARICYRVLQSGQKHLLRKTAVTAHTHVFRFCSNFPLLFARHIGMLMLFYPQGDIQQLRSTTTSNIHPRLEISKKFRNFLLIFLLKNSEVTDKRQFNKQLYWLAEKLCAHSSVSGCGQEWVLKERLKDKASVPQHF